MTSLSVENLRYIIFLIDSKIKEHDGKIFCSYKEAKEYASDCIAENYCDKVVMGMFSMSNQEREMLITKIDTIGFAVDKKDLNQLQLFSKK